MGALAIFKGLRAAFVPPRPHGRISDKNQEKMTKYQRFIHDSGTPDSLPSAAGAASTVLAMFFPDGRMIQPVGIESFSDPNRRALGQTVTSDSGYLVAPFHDRSDVRSEERRVGKECVSQGR